MDSVEELRIEYKRLSRHTHFLEKRFSLAVARDLAASLRNWVQMSDVIDEIIKDASWTIKFAKEPNLKAYKKVRASGASISIPLPGSAQSKNMQIAGVNFYDRALSPEEIKALYEAGLNSRLMSQEMTFSDWLNNRAYQAHTNSGNKDISRRTFIDRAANLLGGTHPMCNFVQSEHADWADPYIIESLNMQIGLWPVPYSILMASAQEIIGVFKPYLA